MDRPNQCAETETAKWGLVGTLLWGLAIAALFYVVQLIVIVIYALKVFGNTSENVLTYLSIDGTLLSLATFATLLICVPAICGVVKLKRGANAKEYLALHRVRLADIGYWAVAVVLLILVSDVTTYALGKPLVEPFMSNIYGTSDFRWLLFLTLVFAAPVFEEIFFRGFLLSGLQTTFLGSWGATIATSAAWASIHTQYDLYYLVQIFIFGMFLGFARVKTNSVITTVLMHSIINAVAFIEVVIRYAQLGIP